MFLERLKCAECGHEEFQRKEVLQFYGEFGRVDPRYTQAKIKTFCDRCGADPFEVRTERLEVDDLRPNQFIGIGVEEGPVG